MLLESKDVSESRIKSPAELVTVTAPPFKLSVPLAANAPRDSSRLELLGGFDQLIVLPVPVTVTVAVAVVSLADPNTICGAYRFTLPLLTVTCELLPKIIAAFKLLNCSELPAPALTASPTLVSTTEPIVRYPEPEIDR